MPRTGRSFAAASVRISSTSNAVRVVAEDRDDVLVDGEATVDVDVGRLTVRQVRSRLTVYIPAGTALVVGTTSGRAEVDGPVGSVAVATESGSVRVASAPQIDVRTTSGRVEVGDVEGRCAVQSVSGSVSVVACGVADAATRSGRIELARVTGPVRAHCVSGHISVEMAAAHDVDAETVSGRVTISLPAGTIVHRDDSPLPPVDPTHRDRADCTIRARSVSGRVQVVIR